MKLPNHIPIYSVAVIFLNSTILGQRVYCILKKRPLLTFWQPLVAFDKFLVYFGTILCLLYDEKASRNWKLAFFCQIYVLFKKRPLLTFWQPLVTFYKFLVYFCTILCLLYDKKASRHWKLAFFLPKILHI